MRFKVLSLAAGFLVTTQVLAQQAACRQLVPPDGAGLFGTAVAISEGLAIVAAPGRFGPDACAAVYQLEPQHDRWALRARLAAGDGTWDLFGWDVATHGGLILVGAGLGDGITAGSGTAYLFEHDGSGRIKRAKLSASDGLAGDVFGCAVDLSKDHAVIGAMRGMSDTPARQGVAYVFESESQGWIEQARLTASDGDPGDMFGESVALHGRYVAVGAPRIRSEGGRTGAAYVYRFEDSAWIEEARLVASDATDNDAFGWSVSMQGERLVVGALNAAAPASRSGAAYVFRRIGSSWIEEAKLTASDGAADARFGSSVCIDGDLIAVGSFWRGGSRPGGAAYAFARTDTGWVEKAKLVPDDVSRGDHLGWCVSTAGNSVLVGAMGRDTALGTAYIFDLALDLASGHGSRTMP